MFFKLIFLFFHFFFFLFCLWDRVCVDWLDCGVDVVDVCCFHGLATRTMTVMAMMAIAMEIKSFHDGVPENRIRERFALTLGILKRGAGIESGAGAQSAERK